MSFVRSSAAGGKNDSGNNGGYSIRNFTTLGIITEWEREMCLWNKTRDNENESFRNGNNANKFICLEYSTYQYDIYVVCAYVHWNNFAGVQR